MLAGGFGMLKTRVDERGVSWAFTFGVPRGSIAFGDIAKVEIARTGWREGYGIHWTFWHGWLWNVAGRSAVMLYTKRGNVITLGTNDPHGLYDAIVSRLPNPENSSRSVVLDPYAASMRPFIEGDQERLHPDG